MNADPAPPAARSFPRSWRDAVIDHLHEAVFLPVMLAHALAFWALFMPALISTAHGGLLGATLPSVFDALGWPMRVLGRTLDLDGGWRLALWAANSVLWGAAASVTMRVVRSRRAQRRPAA